MRAVVVAAVAGLAGVAGLSIGGCAASEASPTLDSAVTAEVLEAVDTSADVVDDAGVPLDTEDGPDIDAPGVDVPTDLDASGPDVAQCVAQPRDVTCKNVTCGAALNNCGEAISCGKTSFKACDCPVGEGTQTRQCLEGGAWSDWAACICPGPDTYLVAVEDADVRAGVSPSAVLDAENGKLLIVTQNDGDASSPWLYRCELDGTGCAGSAIGASQTGWTPSAVVDPVGKKLYVATNDRATTEWSDYAGMALLTRCNLDGSGCTATSLSGTKDSGYLPSVAFDAERQRAVVAVTDDSNLGRLALYIDGLTPSIVDASAGQGQGSGNDPSVVIDAVHDKLLVVTENGANESRLSLYRCEVDGSACTHHDLSAGKGPGNGYTPSAVVDTENGKLLVVTSYGANGNRPSLVRCDLDGSNCTHTALTDGEAPEGNCQPSAAIDPLHNRLVVAFRSRAWRPFVVRCELDGTGCAAKDISAGQPDRSAVFLSAVVEPTYGRLIVGASNETNDYRLGLFLTAL